MNRRRFLKTLGALAASSALPGLAVRPEFTLADVQAITAALDALPELDPYIAFIHPARWVSLVEYTRRWEWEEAWRAYRIAKRDGDVGELSALDAWNQFGKVRMIETFEVGRWEGMRVLQSAAVLGTGVYKIRTP